MKNFLVAVSIILIAYLFEGSDPEGIMFMAGFFGGNKKKNQLFPRPPIQDEAGVKHEGETDLYSATSVVTIADLICEGEIEGLVSGEYRFAGEENNIGYTDSKFNAYTALDANGNCTTELGYLRSVYWNEVPIVDKDGFYNFQEVNLNSVKGLPQGEIPSLSAALPSEADSKGNTNFELTLFRNIGERLFGPSLDLSTTDKTPGYQINWPLNKSNPATIAGEVDRNSKVYSVLNKECVAVQVNIKVTRLQEVLYDHPYDDVPVPNKKKRGGFFSRRGKDEKRKKLLVYGNGDTKARKIRFQIYTRPIYDTRNIITSAETAQTPKQEDLHVAWKSSPDVDTTVFGRIEEPYLRSIEIDFRKGLWKNENPRDSKFYKYFQGWEVKIVRLTPDSVHSFLKNESFVDSLVEIYDSVIRYPYCGMVYSKFSAEFFSRIPTRAYETKLLKIKVPNTYDPILRKYTEPLGYWDGCFSAKKQWTNNPAWCFYDLITNNRYGLGEYIDSDIVDKWTLYEIAKYCDTLVPDGRGGLEPRFSLNHIITSREEAYKVVNDIASAFRAIVYFAFGGIYVSQDRPKAPIYLFNNSNVLEGNFAYSSSAKRARHTVAIVRYNDKNNFYQPSVCYVEDQLGIQRYGIKEIETSAIGCTSEGQAKRFGEWILRTEILQTETVAFTAGNEGAYMRPGDVISIYDENRNERKLAGRTIKVEENAVGLIPAGLYAPYDRATSEGNMPVTGNVITLDKPLHFEPSTEYKLSILTPTNNYEPSKITASNCVETVTVGDTKSKGSTVEEEVETLVSDPVDSFSTEDKLPLSPGMSLVGRFSDNFNDSHTNDDIFKTEKTITVTEEKAEYSFAFASFQNGGDFLRSTVAPSNKPGFPKRIIIEDSEGNVLAQTRYIGAESQTPNDLGGIFKYSKALHRNTEFKHGQKDAVHSVRSSARNGDLFECLLGYSTDGASSDIKSLASSELTYLNVQNDGGTKSSDNFVPIDTSKQIALSFTKPVGVTSIVIKVIHPITTYAAKTFDNSSYNVEYSSSTASRGTTFFRDIFKFVHLKKTKTFETVTRIVTSEEAGAESITVNADNADEALTSADYPEIRKNQVQTIYFSGYQALPHTGDVHSDFSINGSGIVTKIFFDSGHQAGLNFTDYSITGYNNSSVIGDLAAGDIGAYSSEYKNPDGANLIWAIEPRYKDSGGNRRYTLDSEIASGEQQTFKVINIVENENKYDITAIEHNEEVFQSMAPPKVDYGLSIGGPVENVRVDKQDIDSTTDSQIEEQEQVPGSTDDRGACCISKQGTQANTPCFSDVTRSECDELGGEFFIDKNCEQIKSEGFCEPTKDLTPNIPQQDTENESVLKDFDLPLKFKLNLDLGDFSPSHKVTDQVVSSYKLVLVKDEDVFGDMSDPANIAKALDYYNFNVETETETYDNYTEKTDQYGDLFLATQEVAYPSEGVAFLGLGPQLLAESYSTVTSDEVFGDMSGCGHSAAYLESLGYYIRRQALPVAFGAYRGSNASKTSLNYQDGAGNTSVQVLNTVGSLVSTNSKWDDSVTAKSICNDPVSMSAIFYFDSSRTLISSEIKDGKFFWVAPPNEKYKISVYHSLYSFDNFVRKTNGQLGTQKDYYDGTDTDIRHIHYEDLAAGTTDGYVEGCLCDESDSNKPYADVDFNYLKAVVPNSSKVETVIKNYSDFGRLNLCKEQHNEEFSFDVSPKVSINYEGEKAPDFSDILQLGDKELNELIKPGQYAMFTVMLSPEFETDSDGEIIDCHDQIGYQYTFAVCLNDVVANPSNAKCQSYPAFYAVDPSRPDSVLSSFKAPKIYDTPKDALNYIFNGGLDAAKYEEKGISDEKYMPIQYPGRLLLKEDKNGNPVTDTKTECLYVKGTSSDEIGLSKYSQVTAAQFTSNGSEIGPRPGRGTDDSKLSPTFTFGENIEDVGTTMLKTNLIDTESSACNSVQSNESHSEKVFNVHINLASPHEHTFNSSDSSSNFYPNNIEDLGADSTEIKQPIQRGPHTP